MAKAYWKFFNVIKFDRRDKYMLTLIIIIFSLAFILLPVYYFFDFPEDKSATFNLSYAGDLDANFVNIDYSGIENKFELQFYRKYFLDGMPYYTDASGIIKISINDYEWHTFTMIFGGVEYTFTFNDTITENIILATKSIDATAYWDEIDELVVDGAVCEFLDLLYYDGTSWVVIETIATNSIGTYQFSNLVMGLYALSESGDWYTSINFTIGQPDTIYTDDLIVVPDKTIIDVDYFNSIHGADYAVDLTTVDWTIFGEMDSVWYDLSYYPGWFVSLDISDISNGRIVIYELNDNEYLYKIVFGNAWNMEQAFLSNELTEVSLTAKSVEAEFLWTFGDDPVVDASMAFYYWDGTEFVYYADYPTDENGKIYITELLPVGTYMFEGQAPFDIIADDVVKIESYSIVSLSGKGKLLYFIHLYEQEHGDEYFFLSLI